MQNPKVYKVEVSAKTIIFTVVLILFLVLVWTMRDLLLSLFLAFILTSTVKPLVSRLKKAGIPRQVSVIGIFFLLICLFGITSYWVFPPLINETTMLAGHLPAMLKTLNPSLFKAFNLSAAFQYAPNITNQVIEFVQTFFSNFTFLVTTLFFAIYMTIDEMFLKNTLGNFFGEEEMIRVTQIIEKTERRLGSWLVGELLLMLIVGSMTFIGLTAIGVRYALPLAIIAGLLEIVPNIGPILSAVPAFIVAIAQSSFLGIASIVLYVIVQQLENHIAVPLIMKRVIGLSPIITLISLIIGGRFFGILGVLLSIPFTLFVQTLLREVTSAQQKKE